MNVKTLAALVGTLSLGSLATGCATTSSAAAPTEKGLQDSSGATKPQEGQPSNDAASATPEKGGNAGCGAGGCGAGGCGGASNPK
jgi:uncharacterized low-complexity protein